MSEVTMMVYTDADDLDFFGALSVLAKAGAAIGPDFFKIGSQGQTVRLSSGVVVDLGARWLPLHSAMPTKSLILPGGPGALAAADNGEFTSVLHAARAGNVRFYTCCTGASILGAIGLLDGMNVAMHHLKRPLLAKSGCAAVVEGLVRDHWLTSVAGDMAPSVKSVDLAVQLMRDTAPDILSQILERMELKDGRPLRGHVTPAA